MKIKVTFEDIFNVESEEAAYDAVIKYCHDVCTYEDVTAFVFEEVVGNTLIEFGPRQIAMQYERHAQIIRRGWKTNDASKFRQRLFVAQENKLKSSLLTLRTVVNGMPDEYKETYVLNLLDMCEETIKKIEE